MRYHQLAAIAALPLLIGCGVDRGNAKSANDTTAATSTEAASAVRDTYALGTSVNRAGAIPEEAAGDQFTRGVELFLSVNMSGASTAQTVEVLWRDERGRVDSRVAKTIPQGAGHVSFSSGSTSQWAAGPHHAVIVIDGRRVAEKAFALL